MGALLPLVGRLLAGIGIGELINVFSPGKTTQEDSLASITKLLTLIITIGIIFGLFILGKKLWTKYGK